MKSELDAVIATALIKSVNREWFMQMHRNMVYIAAGQAVAAHGYAQVANMLRDIADLIEDAGMKAELPNGN